eukprot:GILJ01005209.1.p1 GENE.GILJ01005209.1~~GILJ01005209.1.p1  ORF type:complete len:346 (-),score=74.93 GILJ01005209.1:88-1125(-)
MTTPPVLGETYPVAIGESILGDDTSIYHTFKYEFQPASIDRERSAVFLRDQKNAVSVDFMSTSEQGSEKIEFRGNFEDAKMAECVLIFDGTEFIIHKLTGHVKNLKHLRSKAGGAKPLLDIQQPVISAVPDSKPEVKTKEVKFQSSVVHVKQKDTSVKPVKTKPAKAKAKAKARGKKATAAAVPALTANSTSASVDPMSEEAQEEALANELAAALAPKKKAPKRKRPAPSKDGDATTPAPKRSKPTKKTQASPLIPATAVPAAPSTSIGPIPATAATAAAAVTLPVPAGGASESAMVVEEEVVEEEEVEEESSSSSSSSESSSSSSDSSSDSSSSSSDSSDSESD